MSRSTCFADRSAPEPRMHRMPALAWLLAAVGSITVACGRTDSRVLEGSDTPGATGGTRASSGGSSSSSAGKVSGKGGKRSTGGGSGGAGGTRTDTSGGLGPGGDGVELGGGGATSEGGATCGNGSVEHGEECDDGNLQPGDGCDAQCRKESCGNGRVDAGEQCDPPKAGSCTDNCNRFEASCGNGKVEGNEECDDGNDKAGDGCFECKKECGDGKIDASIGEQCEPEYNVVGCTTDCHCSADCHWLPICGDGIVQTDRGEECDPGDGVTCIDCKFARHQECDGAGGCGGESATGCMPDAGPVNNGNFDSTLDDWSPSIPGITTSLSNDGSPAPKSLEVDFASSPVRSEAGAYQCVPLQGGTKYTFSAKYRIPAGTPDGVGATVIAFLYTNTTQCSGAYQRVFNGPVGTAQDSWTNYSFQIDLSQVSMSVPVQLYVRLDTLQPANTDGSRVLWDSVSLTAPGARCGDCTVDLGEECDDGIANGTQGDLCNQSCRLESCGNGVKEGSEQCDDGNTTFTGSDTCTPGCRTADGCDTCSATSCTTELEGCFGLTGVATAGPRAGTARSTLCDELLTCVRTTSCDLTTRARIGKDDGPVLENCYCGTTGTDCFTDNGAPNGMCRAQVEAALETTNPSALSGRFDGSQPDYPIFEAVRELLACQKANCDTALECARNPSCGDGKVEDRDPLTDTIMIVGGKPVACDDTLTASGLGCSREECDDGANNGMVGDPCDQYCLLASCGNYVTEQGEACDDGPANGTPGDGCNSDCTALFSCGDGTVTSPYEDCDPGADQLPRLGTFCTPTDAQSVPNSCGCDTRCKYIVCGDGVVDPGEQCDPPNGGTCGPDCKVADQGPCIDCIEGTDDGAAQRTYCDSDPRCIAVEQCAINSGCFAVIPVLCYCGITDPDACGADAFTPTGPCAAEIRAGEPMAMSNNDVLQGYFDFGTSTGVAMNILNDVQANQMQCNAACFE